MAKINFPHGLQAPNSSNDNIARLVSHSLDTSFFINFQVKAIIRLMKYYPKEKPKEIGVNGMEYQITTNVK